ncbi:unnamed protein product [Caenorhabditis nigoni]
MIPEILYFISLVLILYKLQTLSNQNDRVLETVSSMQYQFGEMERNLDSLVSQKLNHDEPSIANVPNNMKFPKQDSTDKMKPINPQVKQSTSETAESTSKVPIQNETFRYNAADYMRGATVDMDHSSSSSLNPLIGYDQTNLVLLDRPHPPSHKAWCTNSKNPVLTINLSRYIKPNSVSYQHSKCHGRIPNCAPKTYDVVACLDFYCEKWTPLVTNCKYSRDESKDAEQVCNISSHLDVPSIGKVQFRFHENYGDTKMTCVSLVRVYGETKTLLTFGEQSLESAEICADLKWYYHNSYLKYLWANKNCVVLYNNKCCSECPECCQECVITDYNGRVFLETALPIIFMLVMLIIATLVCVIRIYLSRKRSATRRKRRNVSKNRHTRVKT